MTERCLPLSFYFILEKRTGAVRGALRTAPHGK